MQIHSPDGQPEAFRPDNVVDMETRKAAQASATQIASDMGVDEIARTLLAIPAQIRDGQEAVQAAKQIVEEAKAEVELQEALLTAAISEARDPKTGKAMFTNETARRSELAKQMSVSEEYKQAAQYLAEAETAYRAAQFDVEMLVNEFSALRAVSRLISERLGLMRVA